MKTNYFVVLILCSFLLFSCKKNEEQFPSFPDNAYSFRAFIRNTDTPFDVGSAFLITTNADDEIATSVECPISDLGYFFFNFNEVGDKIYVAHGDSVGCVYADHCPIEFNPIAGKLNRFEVIPRSWVKFKIIDELPLSGDTAAVAILGNEYLGAYPLETLIPEGDSLMRPVEGSANRSFTIRYRVSGTQWEPISLPSRWISAFDTTTITITY